MLQRPVTSAFRLWEAPKLPSSGRTSPKVLAGTDGNRTHITLALDQAAAAVPRRKARRMAPHVQLLKRISPIAFFIGMICAPARAADVNANRSRPGEQPKREGASATSWV